MDLFADKNGDLKVLVSLKIIIMLLVSHMKKYYSSCGFLSVLIFSFFVSIVHSAPLESQRQVFCPTTSKYASWVFLGMVENEIGEVYNYFFELQRRDQVFHAEVAIFDYQTKKMLLSDNSVVTIENPSDFNWMIGKVFLRYNEITNSWVFGLKESNKIGFNFKVSMLNKPEDYPLTRYFHDGIAFVVVQAGQLNGHVSFDGKEEQFVTAKNTWFRQIWLKNDPKNLRSLNSLLCRFNDGRGLYSIQVLDAVKERDSIAGLFDSDGKAMNVSQFVQLENFQDSSWHINVSTPKMNLQLIDIFQKNDIVAGYIHASDNHGFCMLINDEIGVKLW